MVDEPTSAADARVAIVELQIQLVDATA